ncbi:MAG: pyrroline-5-carboxylate reductase, partial [Bacillota bacterium]|nr:pyrroline-5-carboxylate reductase [Bacillota bacterium]
MRKLVIIGAGSIAEAIISGIVASGLLEGKQIWVTNRSDEARLEYLHTKYGVGFSYDLELLFKGADAVVLAMKPKDARAGIQKINSHLTSKCLILSVLAGISIAAIEALAGKKLAVVRAMPNTSATVGKSATALAFNQQVSTNQAEMAKRLFETVGIVEVVNESQLDAVTGLSGSGPAYIYYLIEAMENSAVEIGLERELAKNLIVQTLLGAAEMVSKSEKPPKQLRQEVTSPGGTTEAGIRVLDEHRVQQALVDCIKEATAQS